MVMESRSDGGLQIGIVGAGLAGLQCHDRTVVLQGVPPSLQTGVRLAKPQREFVRLRQACSDETHLVSADVLATVQETGECLEEWECETGVW
jgi:hypothetical protein